MGTRFALKIQKSVFLGSSLALVALGAGCSSVPVMTDPTHRGLFQKEAPLTLSQAAGEASKPQTPQPSIAKAEFEFVWPLKEGSVSSFFGKRRRDFHEGIDIRAARGTSIYASRDGEVIYSSRKIHGYGNMVVIRHSGGFASVYAHCQKNVVKKGAHVNQGDVVAYVGRTGKATGPHLHFEIRKNELAEDPLLYLPPVRSRAVARR